jgi:hypothetical protein
MFSAAFADEKNPQTRDHRDFKEAESDAAL